MNRRIVTLIAAVAPVFILGLLGAVLRVPFVALGPGPTFNTLGIVNDKQVVDVRGIASDPVTGNLNMTTVQVHDGLNLFEAASFWLNGRYGIVPRSTVQPPGKTRKEINEANAEEFRASENSAELATLSYLARQRPQPTVLRVGNVADDSPAHGKLFAGDELVSLNGIALTNAQSVVDAVAPLKPGAEAAVVFRRQGKQEEARIKLAARQDDKSRGQLGITPGDFAKPNFNADFNLSNIGGPSAGLMFTLALIDKLTPGELTGGKFIAGTGSINGVGQVGAIGGIQYKMMAAREAGAVTFLVPDGNCEEARQRIPGGLRLVRVKTVDDAVNSLNALQAGRDAPSCG